MWIARDKDRGLYIYDKKPIKLNNSWTVNGNFKCVEITEDNYLFPEIKWEDEEPTELILKK